MKTTAKKLKYNNHLAHCNKEEDCQCTKDLSKKRRVDLVLLIDSSGSMRSKAEAINKAAKEAFLSAHKECDVDIRDVWLWVDRAKPGSTTDHALGSEVGNYTQSHQVYLESIGVKGPFYHDAKDTGRSYASEQGADAIADISQYFDWRKDACRSIFYVSDTTLEGVGSNESDNDKAKKNAVKVANIHNVTLFAHRSATYNPTGKMSAATCDKDYHELCTATGGYAETGTMPTVKLYHGLISQAICTCDTCTHINPPEIKPCIDITWGESLCDCMETDDIETMKITVSNCYADLSFDQFSIDTIEITQENGTPVNILPNHQPSVEAIPKKSLCFGSIPACTKSSPSSVSQEFVLRTRGAKEGKYLVNLNGITFDVNFHYKESQCFSFNLCKD